MDAARHKQLVGRRLRTVFEALGLQQAQVARELNESPQKINNWLRGDNYPSEWFVYRFCARYGITMDYLYRGVVVGMPQALAAELFAKEEASQEGGTGGGSPGFRFLI